MKCMKDGVGIVVGKTMTNWTHETRWNLWVASRAYSYWRYQVTMRRAQSSFNLLNCISGSNSVYRSSLLDQVLVEKTPYIVDDTYWTLETHRRDLGRIVYAPEAVAHVQDRRRTAPGTSRISAGSGERSGRARAPRGSGVHGSTSRTCSRWPIGSSTSSAA